MIDKNRNPTYEHYGSVLRHTPFENDQVKTDDLPYSEDFALLGKPYRSQAFSAPNRICYQPMEGQDAADGLPSERTYQRYRALAAGGAGMIWLEATAICPEGKSNPHQLEIRQDTLEAFKRLVSDMKEEAYQKNGVEPFLLLQLTHSGRYSKPNGSPEPLVAYSNPALDTVPPPVISDEQLSVLPELYAKGARLAEQAGFDGVDIKCCHGYLLSELLSAFDRDGRYGGPLENRARLLLESVDAVCAVVSEHVVKAVRLNVFDGYGGPYSFGQGRMDTEGVYDLSEPQTVVSWLEQHGVRLINVTMGSPYRNPDVSRPYRNGLDKPKTNALTALSRLMAGAAEVKREHPSLAVVDTGISLLGERSPNAAAGLVAAERTDFVGFGRMSFAYPDLARDILRGTFNGRRACVACGGCSILKKNLLPCGCILRDPFYRDIYRQWREKQ